MKDSQPSFVLFAIASVLAVSARVMEWELLELIAKPMVIPAIFYYYLQTKTRKTSIQLSAILAVFFIGDMIILLDSGGLFGVMVCGMIAHLLLISQATSDRMGLNFSLFNITFLALLLLLPSYVLYTLLQMGVNNIDENYFFFLSYGVILIAMVAISVINYLSHGDTASLYLATLAIALLVSDLLYSISKFIIPMLLLEQINLVSQFMAYYFIVRYYNARRELKMKKAYGGNRD
ncbi:MAG TPA: lysoplasmalogenase family protein [Flavobacterium sp.]|nr:lysoplasmalogenase family protein [Flavobacterium sp.]